MLKSYTDGNAKLRFFAFLLISTPTLCSVQNKLADSSFLNELFRTHLPTDLLSDNGPIAQPLSASGVFKLKMETVIWVHIPASPTGKLECSFEKCELLLKFL